MYAIESLLRKCFVVNVMANATNDHNNLPLESEAAPAATSASDYVMPAYRKKPMFPQYVSQDLRLKSMQNKEVRQDPRNLAQAGFFFSGMGECFRCFHCGVGKTSSYFRFI